MAPVFVLNKIVYHIVALIVIIHSVQKSGRSRTSRDSKVNIQAKSHQPSENSIKRHSDLFLSLSQCVGNS